MTSRLRPCAQPGCPELTRTGRCATHRAERERARGTARQRGYDTQWERIRRRYLARHQQCQWDEGPPCTAAATDVHHRDGRGPRGDNSDVNLQALCKSHHSRVTARGGFGRVG